MEMKTTVRFLMLALSLAVGFASTAFPFIPVTGVAQLAGSSDQVLSKTASDASQIELAGEFKYGVVHQPKGEAGFVSTAADTLTQFSLAEKYGSQGFLAHNYLAGASFFDLGVGSRVTVTYSDGHRVAFVVREIRHLQALQPNSPTTSFLDLDHQDVRLNTKQLFMQIYGVPGRLVLQTCIARDKELSWGRLFIIATPAEERE